MQSVALKKEAKKAIDELSEEKVKVAIDFIDYLKEKEEMEATLEILSSRELMAQIDEAEKAIKKGKLDEFVPWEKVKRNV
jgi:soluble cytochrome b562